MGQTSSREAIPTEETVDPRIKLAPELARKWWISRRGRAWLLLSDVSFWTTLSDINAYATMTEKIAKDFQNEEIQKAWKTVQVSVLERRAERDRHVEETAANLQGSAKQMEAWAARNAELDNTIEELRAKFSDGKVALDYDAKNVAEMLRENQPSQKEMPCLGQRAHWIDCQKKYALDSRPCDAYVDALERCVKEAVVKKLATAWFVSLAVQFLDAH